MSKRSAFQSIMIDNIDIKKIIINMKEEQYWLQRINKMKIDAGKHLTLNMIYFVLVWLSKKNYIKNGDIILEKVITEINN